MKETVYTLAVIAHPDDEAFLLAGTCMKFAEEGKSVGVICATRGEKGKDRLNRSLSETDMAQIRTKELDSACSLIGCRCLKFGNYPDGGLDRVNFLTLVEDISEQIDKFEPEIILTFGSEGISGHKDHIIIGKASIAAAKTSQHRVKEIWLVSMPSSEIKEFNQHMNQRRVHISHFEDQPLRGIPDEKLLKIDISKFAEQKHEAVKAHQSQYLPHFVFDSFLKHECFEVIKLS